MNSNKLALIILDGWGIGDGSDSDAVFHARTPVFDGLMHRHPHATLTTFGEDVGLPKGQMGNSEVGHLNIGAGRIVYQDLVRINKALEDGSLAVNRALLDAIAYAEEQGCRIHLMGLVSHGGVHSSQNHLHGLVDIIESTSKAPVSIHAFTDGRDTAPRSAVENMRELETFLKPKRTRVASMIGRYYAMDRDQRWERTKKAYDLLTAGKGDSAIQFSEEAIAQYDRGVTDEFFEPVTSMKDFHPIQENDVVICFNFRTDRCRQISRVLTQQEMPEHGMRTIPMHYATMTRYDQTFRDVHVLFEKDNLEKTIGEVVSDAGLSQLRVAETEKYPHVTFFFSGGREDVFPNEGRLMAHSPKVATYDLQPEMSAAEVAEKTTSYMLEHQPDFVCVNFANPDMVGHTGVYKAIVKAVETTDQYLGEVVENGLSLGYQFIIIADHGNADMTHLPDGKPHTAHTVNPVPVIVISDKVNEVSDGILADVAPTICSLMKLEQPLLMSGVSLAR